jgi:endonuclease-3
MTGKDWDGLFAILESWRERLLAESVEDPSVTAIAARTNRDPWAVLVSTLISLRTKDAVTLAASERLLSRAPGPEETAALGEAEIAELIYPAGFFRTKAASIRNAAKLVLERHGGAVPADRDALLAFPGVGLKTANLVLSEAFGVDAICVDVHVHRIANRAGWIATETPDESEAALRAVLPLKYWKRINSLMVLYGQRVCAPVSPRCSACPIENYCGRIGVTRSR